MNLLFTSAIARSDLPIRKTYPTGESETQAYNRQGEVTTHTDANGSIHTDANGSIHAYRRDKLARLTDDSVPTLADGVDALVRRLSTAYDLRGRVQYFTSADDPAPGAGAVINQVKLDYNGLDCLTADAQAHSGVVEGSTPKVQYTCTGAANNTLRRTSVVYPDNRVLDYEYGGAGSPDDVLNRVASLHEDLAVLAEFKYLGLAVPASSFLNQPKLLRTWKNTTPNEPTGDAGDPYTATIALGEWNKCAGLTPPPRPWFPSSTFSGVTTAPV